MKEKKKAHSILLRAYNHLWSLLNKNLTSKISTVMMQKKKKIITQELKDMLNPDSFYHCLCKKPNRPEQNLHAEESKGVPPVS